MDEVGKLREGNRRYVKNEMKEKNFIKRREETRKMQKPFAIIVSCSDSRVSPEYIFDADIGELFIVRNAGNVVDRIALGSIEYAVEYLGVSLIVILGHTDCGAVKASYEKDVKLSKNVKHVIKKIINATKKVEGGSLQEVIVENIKIQMNKILKSSEVCRERLKNGELKIFGALYHLDSGVVDFFDNPSTFCNKSKKDQIWKE
ncbi:MAG: carbonic anhydrase [Archaeoglobaceae archaeon]|nr:carbonic anhydrase [Archaeoglobaceae archaeon]